PPVTSTLSLHDALPIFEALLKADRPVRELRRVVSDDHDAVSDVLHETRADRERVLDRDDEPLEQIERLLLALLLGEAHKADQVRDRKSTRLNSSHQIIS